MTGLVLRGFAAWTMLAAETVASRAEWLADRVDPPPRLTLLPSQAVTRARAMLDDPEGYYRQAREDAASGVRRRT